MYPWSAAQVEGKLLIFPIGERRELPPEYWGDANGILGTASCVRRIRLPHRREMDGLIHIPFAPVTLCGRRVPGCRDHQLPRSESEDAAGGNYGDQDW